MRNFIKRLFQNKVTCRVLVLAIASFIFSIVTFHLSSVQEFDLAGDTVRNAHYIGFDLFPPIFFGLIFLIVAAQLKKNENGKRAVLGARILALSQFVSVFSVWYAHIAQLRLGSDSLSLDLFSVLGTGIPLLVSLIVITILMTISGSIVLGSGLRLQTDMQRDYLGIAMVTTAFLLFINPWVSAFFIFLWMISYLRQTENASQV